MGSQQLPLVQLPLLTETYNFSPSCSQLLCLHALKMSQAQSQSLLTATRSTLGSPQMEAYLRIPKLFAMNMLTASMVYMRHPHSRLS